MTPREDVFGLYEDRRPGSRFFSNRTEAGAALARSLAGYHGQNALVLGVPRGGVPVAAVVARELDAELDVAVARKIGAPGQEELAMGAITPDGTRFLNEDVVALLRVSRMEIEHRAADARREAIRREERYRRGLPPLDPAGRIVIVIDDGLATGATMRATVRSLNERDVKKLIVAIPVGAAESCERIAAEVDEMVCLHRPEPFFAVGLHYEEFGQTSDEDVERILAEHRRRRAGQR